MSFPFLQPYAGLSNSLQTAQAVGGAVGGWVELGRTTLGSAGDNISVASLPDKRYYMILGNCFASSNYSTRVRLNGDTGTNYAARFSSNGGADAALTSQNKITFNNDSGATPDFSVGYLSNLATKEKLFIGHNVKQNTAGAATAPGARIEATGKHAQTTNPIDEITLHNPEAGSFNTNSECVVLGWDPTDTHTTNFWEELASVELGSSGDTLSSSTISAKKYLWCQVFTKATGGTIQQRMRFNSDTGSNYAERYSQDGGADGTITSDGELLLSAAPSTPAFTNMFIVNNQSNEKLVIGHNVNQGGAGAANDPERFEFAHKWANTSNQITQIDIINTGSGDFDTGSIIKVWGAD
jgi:hypothetical protein